MVQINTTFKIILLVLILSTGTFVAFGQTNSNYSLGIGAGISDNNYDMKFSHFQADFNYIIPYTLSFNKKVLFRFGVDINTGVMESYDKTGLILSLGPKINVDILNSRISLYLASMPTYVTRDIYKNFSLGGRFHFLSEVGLSYEISKRFGLEYVFEHISNGGIVKPNPGVNFHMVGIRIYP